MRLLKSVLDYFAPEEQKPGRNLGRNDQCWCGSGRKYKQCHLQEDQKKLKNYTADCVSG